MYHIKDSEFIRGEVPITKEEIRWVSIGKFQIEEGDICLDIGGGTGSISIEMANFASKGKVYVIETNEEAISLINQNIEKFKKGDASHPCYKIVANQEGDINSFSLPEPWNGDIINAKILFISSNPSIDEEEEFPTFLWDKKESFDLKTNVERSGTIGNNIVKSVGSFGVFAKPSVMRKGRL